MKVNTSRSLVYSIAFALLLLFANTSPAQTKKIVYNRPADVQTPAAPARPPKIVGMVYRPMTNADLLALIHQTAINEGVPPKLWQMVAHVESRNQFCTNSPKGARGIVQLMPTTARRFGLRVDSVVDERCNVARSLTAGARYLRWLLNTFKGDVRLALAGYNAGEGAVMQYGWRIPPYKETVQYVEQICALTYGKIGMAIEMAYNPQQAYWLVDALWRGKKLVPVNYAPNQMVAATVQTSPATQAPAPNPVGQNPADDQNADDQKADSPARKTIRVTQLEPRIATRTLSFNRAN